MLQDTRWQKTLWTAWPFNAYQVQSAILEKMKNIYQDENSLYLLAVLLESANVQQKVSILHFFSDRTQLNSEILLILVKQLNVNHPDVSKKILGILKSQQSINPEMKNVIQNFENQTKNFW